MHDVLDSFKTHLATQASRAGVDISGLEIKAITMEHTWGQLVGLFFSGPHAERAAVCFTKWNTRERLGSSYEAQHSPGQVEAWEQVTFPNGVQGHCKGAYEAPNYYTEAQKAERMAEVVRAPGFAVSHTYYSCAD